jgi:SAM-dependent methyltransferase
MIDLGAGLKPYEILYKRYFTSWTSVDVPASLHDISVDVLAAADNLPFEDGSYECIICTEVLEHCPHPTAVVKEMYRVLKPGGKVFLTTPFLVPLHEMPYDFFRYTPTSLKGMAEEAGFQVKSICSKGEYTAVALGFIQLPMTKVWQQLSKRLKLSLYHPYNPFVFATILLPQLIYISAWKKFRRMNNASVAKVYDKLSYATLGYVTILNKP